MVQADTAGAMAAEPEPAETDPPPSWFVYEGPKVSLELSLGASKNITLLGFQAVTNISHEQSIAWGTLGLESNGPLYAEIAISGARTTIQMDLGPTLEVAPGGYIQRYRERLAARGVQVEANGGEDRDDVSDVSAQAVGVENTGTQTDTRLNANANVSHVQS